jgi:nitroimidazol reductase NimA-like FMN-containing flavoprotein (pyridoxamine 5'-phosphate oxidase superfamily)
MNPSVSTALDARYSDQKAVAASWEETRRVLESAQLFWISTVRTDGRPHVTPLVGIWLEDALYFHTGAGEQKFVNLSANPQVVLTTGRNDWDQGLDVVVEGEAVQVTDEQTLERLAQAWAGKWDGRWELEAHDGGLAPKGAPEHRSVLFEVRAVKVFAHAKGDPFGATTHRFQR